MNYTLAVDIGGTFIKYAYVDSQYSLVKQWKKETGMFSTAKEFYDYLCEDIAVQDIHNIGISAPGLVDSHSLVRSRAAKSVAAIYGTNINREVSRRLNRFTASINDAKAAGLCELKIGNGQGSKSSGYLIIGTGVGGCICNETNVIQGVDGFAGEVHFIPYYDKETNQILKLGNQCSIRRLVQLYNEKVTEQEYVTFGHEVTEKYLAHDPVAQGVMDFWIMHLVMDILNMVVTYNPEVICIGGGISEEAWFIELLQSRYEDISVPYFNHHESFLTTRITRCKYNNASNLLGAALHVHMEQEKNR